MARQVAACAGATALLLAPCNGGDAAPVTPDAAPDDWPEGLYGNVTLSEFTGDLGWRCDCRATGKRWRWVTSLG